MARLIRWATGENCSHVAILDGQYVYHSNMRGVNVQPLAAFIRENRIVHAVEVPTLEISRMYSEKKNSYYDIGALLFCGLVLFCRKALGIRNWPKVNLWQSSGMYMCTEFVTTVLDGEPDSLITPGQLYERIK